MNSHMLQLSEIWQFLKNTALQAALTCYCVFNQPWSANSLATWWQMYIAHRKALLTKQDLLTMCTKSTSNTNLYAHILYF